MVTLQILVLSFLVRIQVAQRRKRLFSNGKTASFRYAPQPPVPLRPAAPGKEGCRFRKKVAGVSGKSGSAFCRRRCRFLQAAFRLLAERMAQEKGRYALIANCCAIIEIRAKSFTRSKLLSPSPSMPCILSIPAHLMGLRQSLSFRHSPMRVLRAPHIAPRGSSRQRKTGSQSTSS